MAADVKIIALEIATNAPQALPVNGVSDPSTTPCKIAATLKKYLDGGETGVNAGESGCKYE